MALQIRPIEPGDVKFVLSTWTEAWKKSPWAGCIPNHRARAWITESIEDLVKNGAQISVACDDTVPAAIIGFACHGPATLDGKAVLHFLYVKELLRPLGVQNALMDAVAGERPGFYTYRTRQTAEAAEGWAHVPEIARRKPRISGTR